MRRKFATELKPVSLEDLCPFGRLVGMPSGTSSSVWPPFQSTRRKVPGLTPFPNLA
jgi:hypothetical protein